MNTQKLIDSYIDTKAETASDQKESWNTFWQRSFIQNALDVVRSYETKYYIRSVFEPYFNKNHIFCELGVGTALILAKTAHLFKSVVALDYSPDSLQISERVLEAAGVKNYSLVLQDIRDYDHIKPLYDVVFSNGLIEHFKEPHMAIKSHLMYTKPGGVVIVLAPYKWGLKNLWFSLTDNKFLKRLWPWTEQRFFTKHTMEREVSKLDKKDIESYTIKVLHNVENVLLIIHKKKTA